MTEEEIAYKVNLAKAECRNNRLDVLGYKVCLYFTKQTILDLLIVRNQVNPELIFNECKKGGVFMGCTFKVSDEDKVVIKKEIVLTKESEIKSEMFPEIILPKGSAEFVNKVIADTEKRLKEIAIQYLKKHHLPKFLASLLVEFSYPLLLAKDYELAELKERIKELTIQDTNTVLKGLEMEVLKNSHRDRANNLQEQLTKAKELLELFVQWNYGCCKEPDYKNLVKQAEQILNSEVEKVK